MTGSVLEPGPSVATILARRWVDGSFNFNGTNDMAAPGEAIELIRRLDD
jgi:hypothetical protein